MATLQILTGDCIEQMRPLPDGCAQCCVTSPPYWGLRDYGVAGQIGLEKTPDEYVAKMVSVFGEVRRVLRDDGTLWLNLGDSYASGSGGNGTTSAKQQSNGGTQFESRPAYRGSGCKPKDLVGIPWLVAFALRADGWYLRSDIIWHKPNPMPESVTDRPTKAHEYIFLLSKSARYFYDAEAVKEPLVYADDLRSGDPRLRPNNGAEKGNKAELGTENRMGSDPSGRNKRTVWTVPSHPYPESHFATFPPNLIKPCILAGCPVGGTVLDPFFGSGTVGKVSLEFGRKCIGIELNPAYVKLSEIRTNVTPGLPLA